MSANPQIASQLNKLPLELLEPIISNLTFRDVIALTENVQEGSQVWNAFSISPTWKDVWPMICENRDGFKTLTSFMINVNGRILDLTDGALDSTPKNFLRHVAKQQTRVIHNNVDVGHQIWGRGFHGFNFFEYTALRASQILAKFVRNLEPSVLAFICAEISPGVINDLAPWMSKDNPSEAELRKRFMENVASRCMCNDYEPDPVPTLTQRRRQFSYERDAWSTWVWEDRRQAQKKLPAAELVEACRKRHPARLTAHWTVPQSQAFIEAYAEAQKKLNSIKAGQLRQLSDMYERHHSRLKEPLAPQSPRENTEHIPRQLEITAGHVERVIDLYKTSAFLEIDEKRRRRSTKEGICRFRYAHAALIPYDWCLRLWMMVMGELDSDDDIGTTVTTTAAVAAETAADPGKNPIPESIQKRVDLVRKGMETFYICTDKGEDSLDTVEKRYNLRHMMFEGLPRTKKRQADGTHAFAVYKTRDMRLESPRPFHYATDPDEVEWLVAFLEVVEWMEGQYPELAAESKAVDTEEQVHGMKQQAIFEPPVMISTSPVINLGIR